MTRYVQGADGKFAGSIGDGKDDIPTASDIPTLSTDDVSSAPTPPNYDAMLEKTRASVTARPEYVTGSQVADLVTLIGAKHGISASEAAMIRDAVVAERPPTDPAGQRPMNPTLAATLLTQVLSDPTGSGERAADQAREITVASSTQPFQQGTRSLTEWEAGILIEVDRRAAPTAIAKYSPPPIPDMDAGDPAGYIDIPENRRCTLCGQFISVRDGHGAGECAAARATITEQPVDDAAHTLVREIHSKRATTLFRGKPKPAGNLRNGETDEYGLKYTQHDRDTIDGYSDEQLADLWAAGVNRDPAMDNPSRREDSAYGQIVGMLIARDGETHWKPGPRLRAAMVAFPNERLMSYVARRIQPPFTPEEVGHMIEQIDSGRGTSGGYGAYDISSMLRDTGTATAAKNYLADYPVDGVVYQQLARGTGAPDDLAARMATSGDAHVRATAVHLTNTPIELLTALTQDSSAEVRTAIARSQTAASRLAQANIDALVSITNDPDPTYYQTLFTTLEPWDRRSFDYSYGGPTGHHVYLASRLPTQHLMQYQQSLMSRPVQDTGYALTRRLSPDARECIARILALTPND